MESKKKLPSIVYVWWEQPDGDEPFLMCDEDISSIEDDITRVSAYRFEQTFDLIRETKLKEVK